MTWKALPWPRAPSASHRAAAGAGAAPCHCPLWGFCGEMKCQRIMFSWCVSVDKPSGFNCSPWQPARCNLCSWQLGARSSGAGGAGGTWMPRAGRSRQERWLSLPLPSCPFDPTLPGACSSAAQPGGPERAGSHRSRRTGLRPPLRGSSIASCVQERRRSQPPGRQETSN